MLNTVGGHFDRLWKKKHITDHVISVVWDEGHCVSVWSGFQECKNVEWLQYIIPKHIPFYITSATMPDIVLQHVMNRMKISKDAYFFWQSNDHPNVHISVHKLKYPQNSFHDLTFLIPEGCLLTNLPPKFLIFFNSIPKSIEAAKYL